VIAGSTPESHVIHIAPTAPIDKQKRF